MLRALIIFILDVHNLSAAETKGKIKLLAYNNLIFL